MHPATFLLRRAALALAMGAVAAPLPAQKRDTMALVSPPGAVNFLVVGDWGQHGSSDQRRVARAMGATAATLGAAFIISTGDNIYPDGVRSADDPQFRATWENVYTDKSLQVDWYLVLGNHDYHGKPDAEVEYSKKHPRWHMPARYYTEVKTVAPGVTAEFFFIDTSPIVADFDGRPDKYPAFRADTAAQRAWLDSVLKASTAQWRFIVGHHHIYSGGVRPTQAETEWLLVPRMMDYGVAAYISGHEHHLEHVVPPDSKIHYFISGAGSETRDVKGRAGTRFVAAEMGFLAMSLMADSMVVQAVDDRGKLLYRAILARPEIPTPSK
jgi:hypothetical protein